MEQQYHRGISEAASIRLDLDREELRRLVNEELHRSALSVGVRVIAELLEHEVSELCGTRGARSDERKAHRYGSQAGYVVLGGHKVRIEKPRVRTIDGRREVQLALYNQLQKRDVIDDNVMRRLVRGVSCRNYQSVVETITGSTGLGRSSVSRAFVQATAARVEEFYAREFTGTRFVTIFIDGVHFKGQMVMVAMGVTSEGKKVILSVRQGATENTQVCTDLLEELRSRGVSTTEKTLFVLDGSKALRSAVERVWGSNALIHRCHVHKLRNVKAYVSKELWPEVKGEICRAYAEKNPAAARRRLTNLAKWLDRIAPAAARSVREGLEETLTVASLRLPDVLLRSLLSTNPVESLFQRIRSVTGRVTRWSTDMRIRWCVAGLLEAESRFKRISGARSIDRLREALDSHDTVPMPISA